MTGGEVIIAVLAAVCCAGLLLTYHRHRHWPVVYTGQEWYSEDAIDLQVELARNGVRAHLSMGMREPVVSVYQPKPYRPAKRVVRVHHADLAKVRPIMLAWAERYRQQREEQGAPPDPFRPEQRRP